jgi:hypothetical protein
MLDLRTAQKLVEEQINRSDTKDGDRLIVLEEETIKKAYGGFSFTTHGDSLKQGIRIIL